MFWSMGVISNLYDSSPIKIPCSAYSLSMDLAVAADFWDTDAEAMGEDMHMYLKCFFSTQGKVIVKSIFSPASQCNVQAQTYLTCLTSRYTQAKRHLWGSLDFGYALRKTILGAIAPQSERFIKVKNVDDDKKKHSSSSNSGVPLLKLLALFHRLFEAHLLLGQFFGLLIVTSFVRLTGQVLIMCSQGNNAVAPFLTSIGTSPYIMLSKQISGYFQALSLVLNLTMFFYYERYHNFVGFERWALQEQKLLLSSLGPSNFTRKQFSPKSVCLDSVLLQTQRLGKRPHLFSHRSLQSLSPLDWFVVPISGFCFGALPMFHVQLMQLFTNSLEYEVAMKPKPGIGGSASPNILQTKNMDDDDEEDESVAALLSPASSRTAGDEGFYDTDE